MAQLSTANTLASHISIQGVFSPPLLEEASSVPVQIDPNGPRQSSVGAIDSIDQR